MKSEKKKVKQVLTYNGLRIELLEGVPFSKIPKQAESNIAAFDIDGSKVWDAAPPVPQYQQYSEIKVDSERNVLIATTGSGFKHLINLSNGKVLEYYLVK